MKVIYHKSLMNEILDTKQEADRLGKVIEKIVVTREEYDRLRREATGSWYCGMYALSSVTHVHGIPIEIVG